jgi:hypothetical protein
VQPESNQPDPVRLSPEASQQFAEDLINPPTLTPALHRAFAPHRNLVTDTLRQAWQTGINSGDAGPLDFTELRSAANGELAESHKG